LLIVKYLLSVINNYSDKYLSDLLDTLENKRVFLFIGKISVNQKTFYILLFPGEIKDFKNVMLLKTTRKQMIPFKNILKCYETIKRRLSKIDFTNYMTNSMRFSLTCSLVFSVFEINSEKKINEIHFWNTANGYNGTEKCSYYSKSLVAIELPNEMYFDLKSTDGPACSKIYNVKSKAAKSIVRKLPQSKNSTAKKSNAQLLSDFQVSKLKNVFRKPLTMEKIHEAMKQTLADMINGGICERDSKNIIGAISSKYFEDVGWHNVGCKPLELSKENVEMNIDLDQITLETKNSCYKLKHSQHPTLQELYNLLSTEVYKLYFYYYYYYYYYIIGNNY
jgi:hypothetical protein